MTSCVFIHFQGRRSGTLINATMKISNVEYHESLMYLEGERSQSLIANITKAVSVTFSGFMNVKQAINTPYSEFLVDNTRRYFTSCILFFRDPQWRRKNASNE